MQLITHSPNLRYLTGFTGSKGFLLIGRKKNYFVTDPRYIEFAHKLQKKKSRIDFEVSGDYKMQDELKEAIKNYKTIEFEADHITVNQLKSLKKKFKGKKLIPTKKTVEELRTIKEKSEIKLLRKSQELNKKNFLRTKRLLTNHSDKKLFAKSPTELEVAWLIKQIGHKLGAEDISFEPIVAFGSNSAIPHHQNSNRRLKKNDIVLIDMGLKYKGYCSDYTRTFFLGSKASKPNKSRQEQIAIHKKVQRAQKAAIKAIRAGISCAELDHIARTEMGDDEIHFTHSLGHGVGLEIHEAPRLSSSKKHLAAGKQKLRENMVITIEPGIYLPGKFGVRIEDMILVKKEGFEVL
jgi:Xaa-Pro aminopeptidase